jgi:DoxX-like family
MPSDVVIARDSRKMIWAGRIISAVPILLLLFGCVMSFAKPPSVVEGFHKFGYPQSVLLPIGIAELICTILYLVPRTSVLGAILLTGYLGGATATHVRMLDPSFVMPVIVGVLVWLGLLLREQRLRTLIPWRSTGPFTPPQSMENQHERKK